VAGIDVALERAIAAAESRPAVRAILHRISSATPDSSIGFDPTALNHERAARAVLAQVESLLPDVFNVKPTVDGQSISPAKRIACSTFG
jgi:hypothetical protein